MTAMKPFSDNLIFFDTEFTSVDPRKGEIISIGLVKMNGEELYLEVQPEGEVSPWVAANVVPLLDQKKVTVKEARDAIIQFAGDANPYLISYVIEFDAAYFYKLLDVTDAKTNKKLPYQWIILDFASILFAMGLNPDQISSAKKEPYLAALGIDTKKYRPHHALDDAKLLREVYLKLLQEKVKR
jgi:DNA polymerase-3 subunit epsilon